MTVINIKMDKEYLLDLLYDRLVYWTNDNTAELFCKMYDSKLEQGIFNNAVFDVKSIIDNDYINNYRVFSFANSGDIFEFLLKEFDNGNRYLDGMNKYGLNVQIEAVSDDRQSILVGY